MIDQDNHSTIGNIVKPHGIDGMVNVRLNGSFADEIKLEEPLFILLDGAMVPFFIEEIHPYGNTARIKFEFIDSKDKALAFNGKELFISKKTKESFSADITPMNRLVGYTLFDKQSGFSAVVESFIESDLNPLLIVKSGKKEWMIPYQAELILKTDARKKILSVNLPEGLIDMD